jgi:hypothetical protein
LSGQGRGRTIEAFDDKFFDWQSRQILEIEDYAYVGIKFSKDPDMQVPPRVERGDMGKFSFQSYLIFMSFYIYHFFRILEYLTLTYILCTSVRPVHLVEFSRTRRHPRLEVGLAGVAKPAATVGGLQPKRLREY